jgi:hypothetical protein
MEAQCSHHVKRKRKLSAEIDSETLENEYQGSNKKPKVSRIKGKDKSKPQFELNPDFLEWPQQFKDLEKIYKVCFTENDRHSLGY